MNRYEIMIKTKPLELTAEQIRYLNNSGPDACIVVDTGNDPIAAYTPASKQIMQAERVYKQVIKQ